MRNPSNQTDRTNLNDAKRAEMKRLMDALYQAKINPTEVALELGVSPSTVYAWRKGKSMGTNAQRAALGQMLYDALTENPPAAEKPASPSSERESFPDYLRRVGADCSDATAEDYRQAAEVIETLAGALHEVLPGADYHAREIIEAALVAAEKIGGGAV